MNFLKINFLLLSSFFCCGSGFCSSTVKPPKINLLGESIEWYSYTSEKIELIATITAKRVLYSKNDDGEDCQVDITYSIATAKEFQIDSESVHIGYNFSSGKAYTDIERSIEKNGYNIFATTISEDIEYTFCYNMPYDPYFKRFAENTDEPACGEVYGWWYNKEFTFYIDEIYQASIQSE